MRIGAGDLARGLVNLVGATLGLQLASWLLPEFDVGGWERAFIAAVLVFAVGAVLRPILVRGAVLLGWTGSVLVGLFGQAAVITAVLWSPGSPENGLLPSMLAAWIVAAVSTLLTWVATAGTDEAATASLLRRAGRSTRELPDPDVPGVVFVQMDGVPFPVLSWSVFAGTLPTLSRWVRGGSHQMGEWRPKLPATTPASQMGILHGTIEGIPAFRWVDRTDGKVYVANKPADAAKIEARHSDGRGLLVDDGVSVSNLFTGDAPTAFATMSAVGRSQETKQTRLALAQFLASPAGLARSIPRLIAEAVRELFQSRQARLRDIRPRVHRPWSFVLERAALAGLLRDLNTTLVADAMLRGRRSIYVDYVDYDAIAHHVGPLRPEALGALGHIDAALGQLEKVAEIAPRTYHFVVLSDHGQSQGAVFADRYGEDLAALVARLAETDVVGAELNSEGAGSLNSVMASAGSTDSVLGRGLARASERMSNQTFEAADHAADAARPEGRRGTKEAGSEEFIVFGSGNLGLIYVAGESRRLNLEDLATRFPALVPGLVAHPGVGFVVVDTADHGPVAFGGAGEHRLRDGVVVGSDPLTPFGTHAPEFVLRAARMPEAPDIYVNSLVDDIGEVAAFEGLVGCHGGLGGWQDRASLVWPTDFPAPGEMVVGADDLHAVLVGWLERLGHRADLRVTEADRR